MLVSAVVQFAHSQLFLATVYERQSVTCERNEPSFRRQTFVKIDNVIVSFNFVQVLNQRQHAVPGNILTSLGSLTSVLLHMRSRWCDVPHTVRWSRFCFRSLSGRFFHCTSLYGRAKSSGSRARASASRTRPPLSSSLTTGPNPNQVWKNCSIAGFDREPLRSSGSFSRIDVEVASFRCPETHKHRSESLC